MARRFTNSYDGEKTNTITPYTKRPMSNDDLAALLLSRGLVADRDKLLRVLAAVGYYRLSGYLVPFKDKGTDNLIKGTTLADMFSSLPSVTA